MEAYSQHIRHSLKEKYHYILTCAIDAPGSLSLAACKLNNCNTTENNHKHYNKFMNKYILVSKSEL